MTVLSERYRCPVCFFEDMEYPANDFNICQRCGTEFGNDDFHVSHEELRKAWLEAQPSKPFYEKKPNGPDAPPPSLIPVKSEENGKKEAVKGSLIPLKW